MVSSDMAACGNYSGTNRSEGRVDALLALARGMQCGTQYLIRGCCQGSQAVVNQATEDSQQLARHIMRVGTSTISQPLARG